MNRVLDDWSKTSRFGRCALLALATLMFNIVAFQCFLVWLFAHVTNPANAHQPHYNSPVPWSIVWLVVDEQRSNSVQRGLTFLLVVCGVAAIVVALREARSIAARRQFSEVASLPGKSATAPSPASRSHGR